MCRWDFSPLLGSVSFFCPLNAATTRRQQKSHFSNLSFIWGRSAALTARHLLPVGPRRLHGSWQRSILCAGLLRVLSDIYHPQIHTQRSGDTRHSWKHTYCSCGDCRLHDDRVHQPRGRELPEPLLWIQNNQIKASSPKWRLHMPLGQLISKWNILSEVWNNILHEEHHFI